MTDVRANDQTSTFFRDRALIGYVPADAFASPDERLAPWTSTVAVSAQRPQGRRPTEAAAVPNEATDPTP